MHGSIRGALIALLATLVIVPVADASGARTLRVDQMRAGVATFVLPKSIAPHAVRSARLRVGRHTRLLSRARVRRAALRAVRHSSARVALGPIRPASASGRKLRIRLTRAERRLARSRKPRLLVRKKSPPRTAQPQPAVEQPTAPVTQPSTGGGTTTSPSEPSVPAAGEKSTFRPPAGPVLSDADAAAHVRPSGREPRVGNVEANNTVPTADQLAAFRTENQTLYGPHKQLVTGNFRGTTDEIIQWAAWKWGIDEDVFRAQAAQETWWDTHVVGDNGVSFGLFQVKRTVHLGTYPLSVNSTAFNADYTGALFRYYYDGHATWVMDVEHGKDYAPGDAWGAIGAHYAGRWWAGGAAEYVAEVQKKLAARVWEQPGF